MNDIDMKDSGCMDIEVVDMVKKYRGKTILNQISFTIPEGKCVGILGSNGCGKSTMLSVLGGVTKGEKGEMLYRGRNLLDDRRLHRKAVGYVPQEPPLLEELTAADNLYLWYEKEEMKESLRNGFLAMLGIDSFLKVPVAKMSGGMKKRLAIGCAVASQPQLLILDEPSAALDLPCREQILNYLKEFRSRGGAILLATHDVQEISVCDVCYILKEGKLHPYQFNGNVNELVEQL